MLGDSEGQAFGFGGLLPIADDVTLRAHFDGVPLVVFGVPEVEVIVMDGHADEVFCAGSLVEFHEPLGIELLCFPKWEHVFPTMLRWVAVVLEVVLIVVTVVVFRIHVARVPIAIHRHRLRSPVGPDAELGVAEPVGAFVLGEGILRGLEGAGDFREFVGKGCGAAKCSDERGEMGSEE